MATVAVVGAGTFGTAIAWTLVRDGHDVRLWTHSAAAAEYIAEHGHNKNHLPNCSLEGVQATPSICEAVTGVEGVIVVTPSFAVRETARAMAGALESDVPVLTLSKGLDATGSLLVEAVCEEVKCQERLAVLSGPNHAEEIVEGAVAGTVIAGYRPATAEYFQQLLGQGALRTYTSRDPIGVSLCGAAKNPIAIACGIARGLHCGDNTIALLMTRGLAEIRRLVDASGGNYETCLGLAGVGDLFVTCNSRHSRNGCYGEALAATGISVACYEQEHHAVVEGAHAAPHLLKRAERYGLELPITHMVNAIIEGKIDVRDAVAQLVDRPLKSEF